MKKADNLNEADARLDQALRGWVVAESLPPRFAERVWQRIERSEAQQAQPIWGRLMRSIAAGLGRPSLDVSYVSVLLLTGIIAGYWQARVENNHMLQELSSRYVRMVDPYQTRR
jgi:hypothetical protein